MHFSISGIDIAPYIPFTVAFVVSFFSSMGGVSGAFLLLPFQVSVLGFVSPAVSPTNLVYNIVAIPSGVYRYIREGRMAWPLAMIIIIGTLPGIFIGALIRVIYLPEPRNFKMFVGCVLLYIGIRLFKSLFENNGVNAEKTKKLEKQFNKRVDEIRKGILSAQDLKAEVRTINYSLTKYTYSFYGETFSFNAAGLMLLTFVVGIVGGTYGIGGGAIIAPFLVAFFGLPIYTIAGASLLGTFVTSIAGVIFYTIIAPYYSNTGLAIAPDWILGGLFGAGGFVGMYCGARLQKYIPANIIKIMLGSAISFLSVKYIIGWF